MHYKCNGTYVIDRDPGYIFCTLKAELGQSIVSANVTDVKKKHVLLQAQLQMYHKLSSIIINIPVLPDPVFLALPLDQTEQ